jgi:hypothetical protein
MLGGVPLNGRSPTGEGCPSIAAKVPTDATATRTPALPSWITDYGKKQALS